MARPNPVGFSLITLLAAPAFLLAVLMYKTHTIVDMALPGEQKELSGLSYKAHAFEAKIESVRLSLKSAADADPIESEWTFLGSNTDGQIHRVEIELRWRDASGKQIEMFTRHFILAPGAHAQKCVMETKASGEKWKAARTVEIVANWLS
jgi:hypothetical protein